ncbi:hypothetical protein Ae706Ps2_6581c [Pseudonocardia sp. Ae706_Ps2]|nr:hypothetical protein Ae706Ps2_6581c [Pseudonocardia sp. Ae706_Ps2]
MCDRVFPDDGLHVDPDVEPGQHDAGPPQPVRPLDLLDPVSGLPCLADGVGGGSDRGVGHVCGVHRARGERAGPAAGVVEHEVPAAPEPGRVGDVTQQPEVRDRHLRDPGQRRACREQVHARPAGRDDLRVDPGGTLLRAGLAGGHPGVGEHPGEPGDVRGSVEPVGQVPLGVDVDQQHAQSFAGRLTGHERLPQGLSGAPLAGQDNH